MSRGGPNPRRGILDIAPYIPGKSTTRGEKVFKLSSNESPLGPSPSAVAAYKSIAASLHLYPDGSCSPLRQAIASTHNLLSGNIVCGAGSDELLQLLAHAYLSPGDEAIHSEFGFLVYPIVIRSNGGTPIAAPAEHLTGNVDAIMERVTSRTRMVFLANPNNPTGTYLPRTEIERLHASLPEYVLLVLDEAYAEYVEQDDYRTGLDLVSAHENVVVVRTFSKIYGLAALRLGWAYCPARIVDVLNRIRGPFNVAAPAIAAGVAAIADQDFMAAAAAHNFHWLRWTTRELESLGLLVTPSVGNFLLLHFTDEKPAASADSFLMARGLILRRLESYGLPRSLRMTIGNEEANRAVVTALAEFLA